MSQPVMCVSHAMLSHAKTAKTGWLLPFANFRVLRGNASDRRSASHPLDTVVPANIRMGPDDAVVREHQKPAILPLKRHNARA